MAARESINNICHSKPKEETRGRKPKQDPRTLNINIRVNKAEKAEFDKACEISGKVTG